MTNEERASENDVAQPVESEENHEVDGNVFITHRPFEAKQAKIAKLRKQQEAYENSLPKDPVEAINEIRGLAPDVFDFTEPGYSSHAALYLIKELALRGAFEDGDKDLGEALWWLSDIALDDWKALAERVRRIDDISKQFHPMHEPYRA